MEGQRLRPDLTGNNRLLAQTNSDEVVHPVGDPLGRSPTPCRITEVRPGPGLSVVPRGPASAHKPVPSVPARPGSRVVCRVPHCPVSLLHGVAVSPKETVTSHSKRSTGLRVGRTQFRGRGTMSPALWPRPVELLSPQMNS